MLGAIGQEHLNLEGSILDGGCQVFDPHQAERGSDELLASGVSGAYRVAEFKSGDRGKSDQPATDPRTPLVAIRRLAELESHICGLVDEPARHRHAPSITSGSARSAKTSADR